MVKILLPLTCSLLTNLSLAVWPGSSMHYQQVIETPRYEDMEIEYFDSNPWACLGMGWTIENRVTKEGGADCSPYINLENIDPKWFKAIGGDEEVLKQQVDEERRTSKKQRLA